MLPFQFPFFFQCTAVFDSNDAKPGEKKMGRFFKVPVIGFTWQKLNCIPQDNKVHSFSAMMISWYSSAIYLRVFSLTPTLKLRFISITNFCSYYNTHHSKPKLTRGDFPLSKVSFMSSTLASLRESPVYKNIIITVITIAIINAKQKVIVSIHIHQAEILKPTKHATKRSTFCLLSKFLLYCKNGIEVIIFMIILILLSEHVIWS